FSGGVVLTNKVEEVLLQLPKHFFHEVCGIAEYENMEMNDFIYQATKNYVEHKKAEFILYERMQKGYQEMAPINLKICYEAFLGSEQVGIRPVFIIQNDIGNRFSTTVIVAAITAQIQKAKLPTHVEIKSKNYNLERDSVILLEQIRTLDKTRLTDKITVLNSDMMKEIDQGLEISLGLSFKKMYD